MKFSTFFTTLLDWSDIFLHCFRHLAYFCLCRDGRSASWMHLNNITFVQLNKWWPSKFNYSPKLCLSVRMQYSSQFIMMHNTSKYPEEINVIAQKEKEIPFIIMFIYFKRKYSKSFTHFDHWKPRYQQLVTCILQHNMPLLLVIKSLHWTMLPPGIANINLICGYNATGLCVCSCICWYFLHVIRAP